MRFLSPFICTIAIFTLLAQALTAATPSINSDRIVFGYLQIDDSAVRYIKWNALTHIGCRQTSVNSSGDFTNLTSTFINRDADLKPGGAAEKAGVKVLLVPTTFGDRPGGVVESVFTNATNRNNLISNIVSAVNNATYGCDGVSFDIEFKWSDWDTGGTIKAGIAQMFTDLRAQLPNKIISIYVTPADYVSIMWDVPTLAATCDFILQTGYDYGTGTSSKVHAISDYDSNLSPIGHWINAGMPPEKIVYALSAYGVNRTGVTAYGQTGGTSLSSTWFADTLYDTTLRQANSGPFTNQYEAGDEAAWYTYNASGVDHAVTWDNEDSLEYKIRSTLAFNGTNTSYPGKHLKGVAFWTLSRFQSTNGYDPITGTSSLTDDTRRSCPQIYQLCEEILGSQTANGYIFEKFESLNPHWDAFAATGDDDQPSPDNQNVSNGSTTRAIATSPAGSGAPDNTYSAMQLNFNFTGTPGKLFFRHELINSGTDVTVTDTNAACAKFSTANKIYAYVYVGGSGYTNDSVRLAVFDKNRELEASPAFSLSTPGWHLLSWDLTDTSAGNVNGLTTSEPTLENGNGTIDSDGSGKRDVGFLGFIVERASGGTASGTLYFDELSYKPVTSNGETYTINEFRYNNSAQEFVEIKGPAGAFPTNLELRSYSGSSTTGSPVTTVQLSGQSIPASGYFVVGDSGIANVNYTPAGWSTLSDDISNNYPAALQLVDSSNGAVYDSVSYRTMGGLADLMRSQTLGVTNEGPAWIGETGTGSNSSGEGLAIGRDSLGTDTNNNQSDFYVVPATPGSANGTEVAAQSVDTDFDFTTGASQVFQAYQTPSFTTMPAGRPASSGGGNVYRCVDTTGGGAQGYLGDFTLGAVDGYTVSGELYLPPPTDPVEAVAVGFCGKSGSNFFSSSPANAGYESGYWLVYENTNGASMNDDQPDHGQQFQFVMAQNTNLTTDKTLALGANKSLSDIGISSLASVGKWVPFKLSISPSHGLVQAQVNGVDVYNNSIPSGGPTSGAVQIGYRGFSSITSVMGTFVDTLEINFNNVPVHVSHVEIE
jgi:spore germination protein YaaH